MLHHEATGKPMTLSQDRGAPLLSIVTITRNNASGLRQTIESINAQEQPNAEVELIVVDGGSTDGTRALVKELSPAGTVFISEPDNGVYDAMNKGWRVSCGRFVQFLNSGDRLADTTTLKRIVPHLRSRLGTEWLIAGALHLHGGSRPPSQIQNLPHNWKRHSRGLQPHCHQSCFFGRELLGALGGFSEEFDFVGDFDLILRAGLACAPTEIYDVVVIYEGGGMSASRSSEIPHLLHRVRVERLGLKGPPRILDYLATTLRATQTRIAIVGGRMRRHIEEKLPIL